MEGRAQTSLPYREANHREGGGKEDGERGGGSGEWREASECGGKGREGDGKTASVFIERV